MRLELKWILIVDSLLVLYIFSQLWDLVLLVDDNPREHKILEAELKPVDSKHAPVYPQRPQLIPKIIHQTYKTKDIPERWKKTQASCVDLNSDYQYMFWTDEDARKFIAKRYKWFLPTYDSYSHPIQRVDSVRYFILAYYGGIYIDLDCGCSRPLDTMLTFPAFVRKTDPVGISNDVMGAVPGHPFFMKVCEQLPRYNRNWVISYLTVMYSTGPLFLSVMLRKYMREGYRPGWGDIRLLYPARGKHYVYKYFYDRAGSSWHEGDAKFLMFFGDHLFLTVLLGAALVLGALYLQFKVYQKLAAMRRNHRVKSTLFIIKSHINRLLNRYNFGAYSYSAPEEQLMDDFSHDRHIV